MKLTIEPTPHFFMEGEVMVRMWQGHAEDGTRCVALVACVVLPGQADAAAENLVPIPPPTPEDAERWARHITDRAMRSDDG
jgi:hypothetical protein